MTQPAGATRTVLLVRAGGLRVALRATDVIETFRPLPVTPIAGAPPFVRGLAVVRGEAAPVVSLGSLLGGAVGEGARFVAIRAGARRAVLEVDEVVDVVHLDEARLAGAPPLLGAAAAAFVETLGTHDGQLLAVLASARVVSDAHEAVA